jgi:hypothetical protein
VVELPGGVVAWSVTSASLVRQLMTDSRVSKDPRRHWPLFQDGTIGPDWPLFVWVAVQNMITAYGSEHTRLRRLVAPAFTARRSRALAPRIEAIAGRLIDDLAAGPRPDEGAELGPGDLEVTRPPRPQLVDAITFPADGIGAAADAVRDQFGVRVQRDSEDTDPPGRVLDHGQDLGLDAVEQISCEEVAGQDHVGLGAQELRLRSSITLSSCRLASGGHGRSCG